MKNTTVNVRFDAAKLNALRFYTKGNERSIEEELAQHFEELYDKNVPQNVREYIKYQSGDHTETPENDETSEQNTAQRAPRRTRSHAQSASEPSEISAPVQSM